MGRHAMWSCACFCVGVDIVFSGAYFNRRCHIIRNDWMQVNQSHRRITRWLSTSITRRMVLATNCKVTKPRVSLKGSKQPTRWNGCTTWTASGTMPEKSSILNWFITKQNPEYGPKRQFVRNRQTTPTKNHDHQFNWWSWLSADIRANRFLL